MTLSQKKVLIRGHWPTHGYRLLDWAAILIGWGKSPIKGRGCDHSNVYGEMCRLKTVQLPVTVSTYKFLGFHTGLQ